MEQSNIRDRVAQRVSQRLALVRQAVRVLRGEADASRDPIDSRAVIPTFFPGQNANANLSLVRTANPQEYKPDGAAIRTIGFSRHPVVHACIRVITDLTCSVPLIVLRERGDYESRVGEQHPLQRLLDYPGPRFTARAMRARMIVDFVGYGNALMQIERGGVGNGQPRGLRAINPESLQSVWVDSDGDPRRYDYADWSGIIKSLDVADVIHVRDLEMGRPFTPDAFGFPRGATALASIAADNEATNYVRQVVTNDGTPTFAVLLSDEASQDDATAMQERYKARVVDRGKRGTPAFFGAVRDIKPLGFTLSDLEFPDLRRVSREDICAAFGVDPRMIGIASASSDAGLSGTQYVEARARLVQHTIEPLMSAIEDELNNWLAPEFGDVWITWDHDVLRDLVEDDTATSARVRSEFAASLRTWEESRRALKLSPIPTPTDSLLTSSGAQLVPAAVAVIDPRAITAPTDGEMEANPDAEVVAAPAATGAAGAPNAPTVQDTALNGAQITALIDMLNGLATQALPAATVRPLILAAFPAISPALVDEMIAGLSGFTAAPSAPAAPAAPSAPAAARAEAVTDFPAKGDNKKVSLRNSQWDVFPLDEAEALKTDYPSIWRRGGNIRGNRQFAALSPIAKRGGNVTTTAEENAVRLREAWAARHEGNTQLAGVVAQVKWLVVGSRGLSYMREVLREAKDKADARADAVRGLADKALNGDQIEQLVELLEMVVEGELPAGAVKALILAAFPIAPEVVDGMLAALEGFTPPEEEEEPEDEEPEDEGEEMLAVVTPNNAHLVRDEMPDDEVDEEGRPWWVHLPNRPARELLDATAEERESDPRYRYWKRAMDELDRNEREWYSAARAQFTEDRKNVAALFRSANRQDPILAEINKRIEANYRPGGDYHRAWKKRYEKLVEKMYLSGARQVAGVGYSFGMKSPEVLKAISSRAERLATYVGETTAKQVTAAVRAGETAGLSVQEVSRLIQATAYGDTMTANRATAIARTETAGAMSQGSWDQAQELGEIYKSKEWLAFEDDKTRETHLNCMAEGRIPMDAIFSNGLMYPLDPSGDAAEVINCRCTLGYFDEPAT